MKKLFATIFVSLFLSSALSAATLYWCPSANAFVTSPAHCTGCSAE